ncbi:unnamed protein product [Boreogadus saida]
MGSTGKGVTSPFYASIALHETKKRTHINAFEEANTVHYFIAPVAAMSRGGGARG